MADEYFVQGNEACAMGAIAAGCRFFAGYPITPSTEIAETLAREMPKVGGSFVQMEDEIASIGAVIGASWGGTKSMTATSGPGLSLMQENIGYAFMSETPLVVVDVQRGSPSTAQPTMGAQGDMMQARWGSHGDYEPIALSPASVEEFFYFTIKAFNLAEEYRVPVFLMTDETMGHMREKMTVDKNKINIGPRKRPELSDEFLPFKNVENGTNPMPSFGDGFNIHVTGLTHNEKGYPDTNDPEAHSELVERLCNKVLNNRDKISSVFHQFCDDADTIVISYGSPIRAAIEGVLKIRKQGRKVGYIKIDTPWPFPEEQILELTEGAKNVIMVEMNLGQMYWEIERLLKGRTNVHLLGKIGGLLPTPDELISKINEVEGK
jgi:2-oxoglutarate ferredoxin oxidoreductase subunit alpha